MVFRPGWWFLDHLDLSSLPGIDTARQIDVRVVPGPPEMAIEHGIREYYGETLEWLNVPMVPPSSSGG